MCAINSLAMILWGNVPQNKTEEWQSFHGQMEQMDKSFLFYDK